MHKTEQAAGQTVWQHGDSVMTLLEELITHLAEGSAPPGWKIPGWLAANAPRILPKLHPESIRRAYTLHHDCGKPYCLVVDNDGKRHFPDHAEVSRSVYLAATGDEIVSNLIGSDMCIHTSTADEIDSLLKLWTPQDALTLLLAALAELHSNARLFGGIESNSFKTKWTKWERRGKQLLRNLA